MRSGRRFPRRCQRTAAIADRLGRISRFLEVVRDERGDVAIVLHNEHPHRGKYICAPEQPSKGVLGYTAAPNPCETRREGGDMRKGLIGLGLFIVVIALPGAQVVYNPPPGQWTRKAPAEVGMDPARLNEAVEFMKRTKRLRRDGIFPIRKSSTASCSRRSQPNAPAPTAS